MLFAVVCQDSYCTTLLDVRNVKKKKKTVLFCFHSCFSFFLFSQINVLNSNLTSTLTQLVHLLPLNSFVTDGPAAVIFLLFDSLVYHLQLLFTGGLVSLITGL